MKIKRIAYQLNALLLGVLICMLGSCKKEESPIENKVINFDAHPAGTKPNAVNAFSTATTWEKCEVSYYIKSLSNQLSSSTEKQAYRQAFNLWAEASGLKITEVNNPDSADIVIEYKKIDGTSNVLGYAKFPCKNDASCGDITMDADEAWTLNSRSDGTQPIDLLSVALHEIGHALGLGHSSVKESVMYASYTQSKQTLHNDDIDGIKSIYHCNDTTESEFVSLAGSLVYGSVEIGDSSTRSFTITNTSVQVVNVNSIIYPNGFSGNWGGGDIAVGQSKTVQVKFIPTQVQSYSGNITVNHNPAPLGQPATISVSGSGVLPSSIISLSGSLNFGSVEIGSTSTPKTLTISNVSSMVVNISSIVYPSGFSGDWSGGDILVGQSKNVNVRFSPTLAQGYSGQLTVNYSPAPLGAPANLSLSGIGVDSNVLSGLVLHYDFNNQNANDLQENYDGLTYGVSYSTSIPDNIGYSMDFTGNNNYIEVPQNVCGGWSELTYSVWLKTINGGNLLHVHSNSNGSVFIAEIISSQIKLRNGTTLGGASTYTSNPINSTLLNNLWNHVVITFKKSQGWSIYINGNLFQTFTSSNSSVIWSGDYLDFGRGNTVSGYNPYYFSGKMDNIRVYNRILTQAEISTLYSNKK